MRLYDKNGYLNIPEIAAYSVVAGVNFIFIIGPRQVGKTYGTIKYLLDRDEKFILMRRTMTELDFIASGVISPFSGMGYDLDVKRDSKYTGAAVDGDGNVRVSLMALSTVSKIRGFSAYDYTNLVYDEFIPERHVTRIKNEADAFLNAIVTIAGNRELEGKEPLKVWLLANSNNLSSPILSTFGLTDKIEAMSRRGQEYSVMTDRGVMVILPKSTDVISRRRNTALFKAVSEDAEFSQMALDNAFSYNDPEGVRRRPLDGLQPVAAIAGVITFYRSRHEMLVYVTAYRKGARYEYPDNARGRAQLCKDFPSLRQYYIHGYMEFDTLTSKEAALLTIGIKH